MDFNPTNLLTYQPANLTISMPSKRRTKVGLALGSGGVKGLAHIGVIKVLQQNNIPIDFIAGASIGALVGAHFAAYLDAKKMEEIALAHNWQTAFSLFDPSLGGGLLKGKKVEKLIKEWLADNSFKSLKIPLSVVTTDLKSGREVDLAKGNLIKAVRASLSVPPVFQPVAYRSYLLADGGLCNPLPDDVVRKMGANFVITVNLDDLQFNNTNNIDSLPKISIRALNILRRHLAQKSLRASDLVIEPIVPEIGLVGWNKFFDNRQVSRLIKAGEKAALKALPKIKKCLKNPKFCRP